MAGNLLACTVEPASQVLSGRDQAFPLLPPWRCEICGERFEHEQARGTHYFDHGECPFACPAASCGAAHLSEPQLVQHLKDRHPELPRPFVCDTCGDGFADVRSLQRHSEWHSRLLRCPDAECGQEVASRTEYSHHVDGHMGIVSLSRLRELSLAMVTLAWNGAAQQRATTLSAGVCVPVAPTVSGSKAKEVAELAVNPVRAGGAALAALPLESQHVVLEETAEAALPDQTENVVLEEAAQAHPDFLKQGEGAVAALSRQANHGEFARPWPVRTNLRKSKQVTSVECPRRFRRLAPKVAKPVVDCTRVATNEEAATDLDNRLLVQATTNVKEFRILGRSHRDTETPAEQDSTNLSRGQTAGGRRTRTCIRTSVIRTRPTSTAGHQQPTSLSTQIRQAFYDGFGTGTLALALLQELSLSTPDKKV